MSQIPISILELATVTEGGSAAIAIDNTVAVAKHAESLEFKRLWLAEHHNMEHIASSATSLLIGHVAGHTKKIRVGSGGIMLPNHSPLVIAEQFGTLDTIYPGRIDLGLGRAPGTDQLTAAALRRGGLNSSYNFPQEIVQLQTFFSPNNSHAKVRAFPGEGRDIPIWILGSSTDSAYLAAEMGLPYAFASHFAPAQFQNAIHIYRKNFKPSPQLSNPYLMACVNIFAAETDEEAELLSTSVVRMFAGVITNIRSPLQPPAPLPENYYGSELQHAVNSMLQYTFKGSKTTLQETLGSFIAETRINELMTATYIYDHEKKLKSFSILKDAVNSI